MTEQKSSAWIALSLILGVPVLLALLAAVLLWSGDDKVDRVVFPAGELFVSWDVVFLHGLASLPLAFALALLLRRRVADSRVDLVTSAGVVFLIFITAGLHLDGTLGMEAWLSGQELIARASLRLVVSLCVLAPGAWLLLLVIDRKREGGHAARWSHSVLVAWALCILGFTGGTLFWGYPQIIRKIAVTRHTNFQLGYTVEAQRAEHRLVAITSEGWIRRAGQPLLRSQLATQLKNLQRQAETSGQDPENRFQRAKALIGLARYDEAERLLLEVFEKTREWKALHQLGRNDFGRRRFRRAYGWYGKEVEALRERLAATPAEADRINGWMAYALVQQALAAVPVVDFEEARRLLRESLDVQESAEAHLWLARAQQILGQGRDGRVHLDRYLELQPQNAAFVRALKRDLSANSPDCAPLSPLWWP